MRAVARTTKQKRTIFGEPARIMAPRLLLLAATVGLVIFGIMMVYSSSSITALVNLGDPGYYCFRQTAFAAVGAVVAFGISRIDYHKLLGRRVYFAWAAMVLLLIAVHTSIAGQDAYGASRWIAIGPFTLQPSEFAKPVVVVMGAWYLARCCEYGEFGAGKLIGLAGGFLGSLLFLILLQPDKGTTGILLLTLLIMVYFSGLSGKAIGALFGVGGVGAAILSMSASYSRARIMTMINPFLDSSGSGYQLVQGFYAFGSGGLLGVGIGMSRQKYSYLPMAYNDFIFAVIGEELGFVGTMAVVAAFALFLWAGMKIAENAPDLEGRLIAGGCSVMFAIQFLLNVCGVLGMFPLSGKPVPFISYGGSSVLACLIMVGLIWSVSRHSHLPETVYDRRRSMLHAVDDAPYGSVASDHYDRGLSRAGDPTPRSWRRSGSFAAADSGVRDVDASRHTDNGERSYRDWRSNDDARGRRADGDAASRLWRDDASGPSYRSRSASGTRREAPATRTRTLRLADPQRGSQRGGWERIDLDSDPADRLRVHDQDDDRNGRPRGRRS